MVIRDDSIFYVWFEGHGCLLNQILDFREAITDDSVVIANSRNMDASRKGTIRDDSVIIANLRTRMLLKVELSGTMTILLTGLKGRDASQTGSYQG